MALPVTGIPPLAIKMLCFWLMALDRYRAKRNFAVTAEPAGGAHEAVATPELSFVVQKHQATRLHYDFRLEWRGVLLSWAVPKGPSLDPSVKRLAVAVEDHPIEYGRFEGVIPEGEYGGGTVMVWDYGTWSPEGDVDEGLKIGELKFTLHAKKLKGSWVLVRTKGHFAGGDGRSSWLLIKHKDRYAGSVDIVEQKPRSAVSRRLLAGIAAAHGGDKVKAAKGDAVAAPRR